VVAPKPEINVGECFNRFLAKSMERAGNPDERFSWGSYQNHVDHCNRLRGLTVDGARLEKMMLRLVSKSVAEAVWKAIRKTVSARTTSDRYLVFQQSIRLSCKQGYTSTGPCDLAEIARPDFHESRIKNTVAQVAKVSFQTLALITAHCPPEDRLKIIFAAKTGLRQGEMVALKVYREKHPVDGGTDFDNRRIYVRTAMKKGRSRGDRYIGAPKSVAGFREVPIDADLADALKCYWEALPKRRKGEGWLFPSKDGTALDGSNLRKRGFHVTNGQRGTIYVMPLPQVI
jgi:integrase